MNSVKFDSVKFALGTAALGGLLTMATGAQAAILGQANNGDVLLIDTTNATATLFLDLADVASDQPNLSPNALGYNGSAFRTNWLEGGAGNTLLYRNDTLILTTPSPQFSVAAGDVVGDTYYYVDRQFMFSKVTGINGGSATNVDILDLDGGGGGFTMGDLTISSTGTMYLSYGNSNLTSYDLSGNNPVNFSGAARRYAGLAFDGNTLYGVTGGDGTASDLYRLAISGTTVTPVLVGQIQYNGGTVALTDAAPVPVPAALPLLGSALVALGVIRRRTS
jgi:hypothetical protein